MPPHSASEAAGEHMSPNDMVFADLKQMVALHIDAAVTDVEGKRGSSAEANTGHKCSHPGESLILRHNIKQSVISCCKSGLYSSCSCKEVREAPQALHC